jgi:hypothetical protein
MTNLKRPSLLKGWGKQLQRKWKSWIGDPDPEWRDYMPSVKEFRYPSPVINFNFFFFFLKN